MNKNETPAYYGILPASVRYDKNLSASQKILFTEFSALANVKGYCNATNGYFAKLYDVDPTTVSRWVSKLEKSNHIKTVLIYKENSKQVSERRIYPLTKMLIPIDENVNTPLDKKINTPIDENVKDNNTSFNNTSKNSRREKKTPPSFVLENRKKAKEYAENKTLYFKNENEPDKAMEAYMVENIIPLAKGGMYYKKFTGYNSLKPKRRKELVETFCLENCKNLEGWGDNKMDSNTRLLFHFANWLKRRITDNENQTYKRPKA